MEELISSYCAVGHNMSLKVNFLHAHLDFFLKTWAASPVNMAKGSDRIFHKLERSTVKLEPKCVG